MTEAPQSGRPRPGGRSARVVAAVRAATLELLEEVGFENLQVAAVAERAAVNRTTVYRRWPTRTELVADLLTSFTAEHVPAPDTGSLASDLQELLASVAAALQNRAIRSVLRSAHDAAENDERVREAQAAFWDQRFRLSGVVVERAIARGELPADTDPRELLEAAAGPVYFRILCTSDGADAAYLTAVAARTVKAFAH